MMKSRLLNPSLNNVDRLTYGRTRTLVVSVKPQRPGDRRPELLAITIAVILLSLFEVSSLPAQVDTIHKMIEPKPNVAAASLSSYLDRVRAENSNIQAVPGSHPI